ncbi:MAG: zinc metalloprotease HtpX [Bryobacteraceae bacterium]|nr:zinc metalloprotease HtpX [Solibacteraceae bacterium]MCL4841658.1 zinc metalloprotease HtpX [Bryobacteraceae bacterium]MCO5353924.1 zinc metalloprotease HtpX [Bryobacteraceae bacterium]HAX44973.1 protease HtpX [Bryobacterales bacterium]HRJ18408.1 zinc metalloprotease HtpX [Bryobacteraceae bacterium]
MNGLKTALLLGSLSGLLVVGGNMLSPGGNGMAIGLMMALGMNFFSYFFSEKMALKSSGAIRVSETENPQIYRRLEPMTRQLCQRMGLPMPKLWVIPEQAPNAFATGRNPKNSSVAVTAGLLELMNQEELEGVVAHELAHIKNRDILISSIAATVGAALTYMAHMAMFFGGRHDDDDAPNPMVALLMLILAPVAAGIIQMAISRTREYAADETAARAIGSGSGLASALGRLEGWSKRIPMHSNEAMSHMYIVKPLTGQSLAKLFSTHPATQERIARLRALQIG